MTRKLRRTRLLTVAAPTVLLAVLLTACGDDGDGDTDTRGEDTSQSPEESSTPTDPDGDPEPDPDADPGESTELLHATAVGGATGDPVLLDSDAAIEDFVGQFTNSDFVDEVTQAAQGVSLAEDQQLFGAVVAVGCDVPPGVNVSTEDELTITPQKVPSPLPECLAPVTTVALVTVDAGEVG